jgi:hypothetical protein
VHCAVHGQRHHRPAPPPALHRRCAPNDSRPGHGLHPQPSATRAAQPRSQGAAVCVSHTTRTLLGGSGQVPQGLGQVALGPEPVWPTPTLLQNGPGARRGRRRVHAHRGSTGQRGTGPRRHPSRRLAGAAQSPPSHAGTRHGGAGAGQCPMPFPQMRGRRPVSTHPSAQLEDGEPVHAPRVLGLHAAFIVLARRGVVHGHAPALGIQITQPSWAAMPRAR